MKISKGLSKEQERQVKELLEEFQDIPGETNLIEHRINLTSEQPVRTKQYPLPFAMTETV